MYRTRDIGLEVHLQQRVYGEVVAQVKDLHLPSQADDLIQDLGLSTLFDAMAAGDSLLYEVARFATLHSLHDPRDIDYRQAIVRDCLEHPDIVVKLFQAAYDALVDTQTSLLYRGTRPDGLLRSSVSVMTRFVETLETLHRLAVDHRASFTSEGFGQLFEMLVTELDDTYVREIKDHLGRLRFRHGVLISAALGPGDSGVDHVLRRSPGVGPRGFWTRVRVGGRRVRHGFDLHPRDEAGAHALERLRARGIGLVANALAESVDHIQSFLTILVTELAFYRGCLNLHSRLTEKGEPVCFPTPVDHDPAFTAHDLYDGCLSLLRADRLVANDVLGDHKSLVMITGANRGGKSTLMRAMGLAQVMMQAGMFCCASMLRANVCRGIFTHYKRDEDATMQSGKLDEELERMSRLVDRVHPGSLVLFNESFSATNEREGSEIARQVIDALRACAIKVVFVTHHYDLARSLYDRHAGDALFLRAQRGAGAQRTFRMDEAEPLPTSFGEDVYRRVFTPGEARDPLAAGQTERPSGAPSASRARPVP